MNTPIAAKNAATNSTNSTKNSADSRRLASMRSQIRTRSCVIGGEGLVLATELHPHLFPSGLIRLEELRLLEAEVAGDNRVGERLDAVVIVQHVLVVELPREGDLLLDVGQLPLKLHEVLGGLELRVVLRHGEQVPQGGREHVV